MIDKYFFEFDYKKKTFSYDDIALFEFKAKILIISALEDLNLTLKKYSWMFSKKYLFNSGNPISNNYSSEYDVEICPTSHEDQIIWRNHFDDFLISADIWIQDGPFNDLETIYIEAKDYVEHCKKEIPIFKETYL